MARIRQIACKSDYISMLKKGEESTFAGKLWIKKSIHPKPPTCASGFGLKRAGSQLSGSRGEKRTKLEGSLGSQKQGELLFLLYFLAKSEVIDSFTTGEAVSLVPGC